MDVQTATRGRVLVSIDEAAKALSIGRSLAYSLAQRGELRTIRLGDRRLVPIAELERLASGAEAEAAAAR